MTITYLTNGVIYIGSFLGDCQTVEISSSVTSSSKTPLLIPQNVPSISTTELSKISSKGKGRMLDTDLPDQRGYIVNSSGSYLQVLDTFKNIAPIRDAVLVDLPGTDQVLVCHYSYGLLIDNS